MTAKYQQILRDLFMTAVAAADPMITIPKALPARPSGRVVVVGAGKASARMAEAVESVWGPCEGLVVTRYGHERPTRGIEVIQAGHPVSDQAGMSATTRILDLLSGLGDGDFVLALISGGGSALLCAPVEGLNLEGFQDVHRALLKSGAPIGQMNIIRKHLSRVKGGQLAAAAYPATMLSLMISDVPGDDPGDIASGVSVGEDTSPQAALDIITARNISLPIAALHALKSGSNVVKSTDIRLSRVINQVLSAPSQSLNSARDQALSLCFNCNILGDAIEGEAREEAARQVKMALELQSKMRANDRPLILLSGGECTVSGWGGGVGGPNAEFALAAAISLNGQQGITLIACDTDGVDGAAEVAGAIVHPQTLARATALNISAHDYLKRNDSHTFFGLIKDQVITGPTRTNVNDFRAILIQGTA